MHRCSSEVFSHDRALTSGPVAIGFLAAQLVAMSLAVALLFTRPAREWFYNTQSNGAPGARSSGAAPHLATACMHDAQATGLTVDHDRTVAP